MKEKLVQRLCECNCGDLAKPGNRFICGHTWRGKKFSAGHKKKISESLKGHPVSDGTKAKMRGRPVSGETKKKLSAAAKRRSPSSEETREKISKGNKGKFVSEETRKKQSNSRSRNNIGYGKFWNRYHPYISQYQYRQLQDDVRNRDHNQCVLCVEKGKKLDTHHVVPVKVGYKSKFCDHPSNMITLCCSCHLRVEPRNGCKDKWKEFLSSAKKYLSKFGYEKLLLDDYL